MVYCKKWFTKYIKFRDILLSIIAICHLPGITQSRLSEIPNQQQQFSLSMLKEEGSSESQSPSVNVPFSPASSYLSKSAAAAFFALNNNNKGNGKIKDITSSTTSSNNNKNSDEAENRLPGTGISLLNSSNDDDDDADADADANAGDRLDEKMDKSNGNIYKNFKEASLCPSRVCSCLDNYFDCQRANLKKVPSLPNWVETLDLSGNDFDDSIENSLQNITGLVKLILKRNSLQRIPVFTGLPFLEILNLGNNKIQAITTEPFLSLPNLKKLNLSRNHIRIILPNTFPVNNRLNTLILNYNEISLIESKSFDNLNNLIDLQIHHNNLTNLPSELFKSLNSLKKLDLSHNKVEINWSTFKGLNNLRSLKLQNVGIRNLTDGIFHTLKSISKIDLEINNIEVLRRQGFYNLSSLTELILKNNSIKYIDDDTWEFTPDIILLDLSENYLTKLHNKNLEYLIKLERLILNNNLINYINDDTFDLLKNLKYLSINNNRKLSWLLEDTSSIINPLKSLRNLLELNLSNINAKSIQKNAFINLNSLLKLNLNENNFTTIQFNAFKNLDKLQELYIETDNFLCDCNLQWFYEWIQSKRNKLKGKIHMICDYPINLRGKRLLTLNENDFMCHASPKPRILKSPQDKLALKGRDLKLECIAISNSLSQMNIYWRHDNIDILDGNNTEIKIEQNSETNETIVIGYLNLLNVNHEHTGRYQCVTANSYGKAYSDKFKIIVATYPSFRKIPSNITLNSGSTARLDCSAFGEPKPQIAWKKDGGNDFPAARERRMHVMPTDDAFFIINAKISDMGIYTCTAENPAGIIRADATLIVHEAPSFIKSMENKEICSGNSIVLECMFSGSPKPTLSWFKNKKPIRLTERHYFTANRQLLIIVNSKLSDSGLYTCELKNELGTIQQSSHLIVYKSMMNNNNDDQQELPRIGNSNKNTVIHSDNENNDDDDDDDSSDSVNGNDVIILNGKNPCVIGNFDNNNAGINRFNSTWKNVLYVEEVAGIVVITIFCCAVLTSIVWVAIIYQTKRINKRKRNNTNNHDEDEDDNNENNNSILTRTAAVTIVEQNNPSRRITLMNLQSDDGGKFSSGIISQMNIDENNEFGYHLNMPKSSYSPSSSSQTELNKIRQSKSMNKTSTPSINSTIIPSEVICLERINSNESNNNNNNNKNKESFINPDNDDVDNANDNCDYEDDNYDASNFSTFKINEKNDKRIKLNNQHAVNENHRQPGNYHNNSTRLIYDQKNNYPTSSSFLPSKMKQNHHHKLTDINAPMNKDGSINNNSTSPSSLNSSEGFIPGHHHHQNHHNY